MKVVYIKDILRDATARVSAKLLTKLQAVDSMITGVHFEYGHYTDIQERLMTYSKTSKRQDRYPLICFFEDDIVTHNEEGVYGIAGLKGIILAASNKNKTRIQREEEVFKPILYPIYEEFLNQLWASGKFMIYSTDQIKHRQINRPHWGDPGLYKNEGYLFTDVLDGIELNNLELKTYLQTC